MGKEEREEKRGKDQGKGVWKGKVCSGNCNLFWTLGEANMEFAPTVKQLHTATLRCIVLRTT